MGFVTLEPRGGQVPWHNQEQDEVYFLVEGTAEMCLGEERQTLRAGEAVQIPSGVFHQLTNVGEEPAKMIYVYGPAGESWGSRAALNLPGLTDFAWAGDQIVAWGPGASSPLALSPEPGGMQMVLPAPVTLGQDAAAV